MTQTIAKAALEKDSLERKNERLLTEKAGQKRASEQQATVNKTNGDTEADQKKTEAEEQCEVMKLNAAAEKERAQRQAETQRQQELNKAREEALQVTLRADEDLRSGVLDSVEELAQAQRQAKEIELKAEVEASLATQIRLQREHELGLAQKKVLATLAAKGHYNLVGQAGDIMLKSMMEGDFNIEDFKK